MDPEIAERELRALQADLRALEDELLRHHLRGVRDASARLVTK